MKKKEDKNWELCLLADVSNIITEIRMEKGWTQAQLAKKVGTKQPSIARIENGNSLPSLSFLLRIVKVGGFILEAPKIKLK